MLELEQVRQRLLTQAQLFDDPADYAAGVNDAVNAVKALLQADARPRPDRRDHSGPQRAAG